MVGGAGRGVSRQRRRAHLHKASPKTDQVVLGQRVLKDAIDLAGY
jgi:hypothetical protein